MYKTSEKIIGAITAIYILIFSVAYMLQGNIEFLAYIAVLIIIAGIIWKTLPDTKLDSLALSGLSLWGILHLAGGGVKLSNGGVLYGLHLINIIDKGGQFFILKYDQFVHFLGFAVTAIVIFQILQPRFKSQVSKKMLYFITIISALGLSAANEVIEFAAFLSIPDTWVGDFYNLALDLVFNTLGAITGTIISVFRLRK